MRKKIIFSFIGFFLSCSSDANNFSNQANSFLNEMNGKEYTGVNSANGLSFKSTNTLLAEYRSDQKPSTPRVFQNTTENGQNKTHGIYKVGRDDSKWQGIKIEDGGNILYWTAVATTADAIEWNTLEEFARKK